MAITPQAIKDQEFQSKFRGYDTIEVKAYLELVAEEFFELLEKIRQHEEEIATLTQEKDLLEEVKATLEEDVETAVRTTDEIRRESAAKDEKYADLVKEFEELQTAVDDYEQERKEFEEELSAAEGRVSEVQEELRKSRSTIDGLHNKIQLLEEQNRELKTGEVDFKRTIGAAQRFADDLTAKAREKADMLRNDSEERAQELLKSSEEKAALILETAQREIERLRQEAYAELSRLPAEIEHLQEQRRKVRDDLRQTLRDYLEKLETFADAEEAVKHYDYDELFQKIEIPDDFIGSAADHGRVEEQKEPVEDLGQLDDLDDINMELPLPDELLEDEDESDDLRTKLEEGGIAYLSDN